MRCLRIITNLWSNIMPHTWRRAFQKPTAFAVGSVVLAVILWSLLRSPLRQLWSMLDLASIIHPQPVLQMSPLLVCTGVDSKGVPQGVSDSFTRDQISQSGVMVFLTYSEAVPQSTTYQIRWKTGERIYESAVNRFERAADMLCLYPDKDLPAGNYSVEFLVNGVVQRSASVVIQPSSEDETVRVVPRRKPRPNPAAAKNAPPPIEAGKVIFPTVAPPPPPAAQPLEPVYQMELRSPPSGVFDYKARHWHLVGSCFGNLRLTPQAIEFTSDQHTFKFDIKEVQVGSDGFRDPSGRDWHFSVEEAVVEELLGKWKRGALFPQKPPVEPTTVGSFKESQPATARTYAARHKHLLGSCSGELTLTPDSIEFVSPQHYFKCYIDKVVIEGDGVQDRDRKVWHLEVPGENVIELLRSWKNGHLFQKR